MKFQVIFSYEDEYAGYVAEVERGATNEQHFQLHGN